MSNIRVYKLAQEIGVTSHELVESLQELGLDVTSHMCSITEDEAELVIDMFLKEDSPEEEEVPEDAMLVPSQMTVGKFAELVDQSANSIIMKLMNLNVMATINQNIDVDTMKKLGEELGISIAEEKSDVENIYFQEEYDDSPESLKHRAPVVTVMGHVDHGKTTLLDAMRKTDVTAGEAGGITQHIGASEVHFNDKKIVFLDTPGHESFTTLRARGAQITDIAILVVAADDGVMPQTIEAIDHARAAGVPIIVAINKMDVPNANPNRVIKELSEKGILVEEWGGDVISVNVSALKGEGIDNLLDTILLVAEMEELKANPDRPGIGTVLEAEVETGRGAVATVIVNKGTINVGDSITAGSTYGRVRAMYNYHGKKIKKAGPSTPIEISGLNEVPQAGDSIYVTKDDQRARELAEYTRQKARRERLQQNKHISLDDLFAQIKEGEIQDLNLILKGDVHGSIEALRGSLMKLSNEEVKVNIIHANVGTITNADVSLAAASNAIIIGFNVRPSSSVIKVANAEAVDIRTYQIIYNAINDVKAAMKGMLAPVEKEVIQGEVEVRNIFKASSIGTIAGCYVTEGIITRNSQVRLLRNGVIIYEGEVSSLKRFENDAKEVAKGYECGVTLENFNDVKVGDYIEPFIIKQVPRE